MYYVYTPLSVPCPGTTHTQITSSKTFRKTQKLLTELPNVGSEMDFLLLMRPSVSVETNVIPAKAGIHFGFSASVLRPRIKSGDFSAQAPQ